MIHHTSSPLSLPPPLVGCVFSVLFPIECWRNTLKLAVSFLYPENYNPHVLPGVKQQSDAGNIVLRHHSSGGNTAVLGCMVKSHS